MDVKLTVYPEKSWKHSKKGEYCSIQSFLA